MNRTHTWGSPRQATASLVRPGRRIDVLTDQTVLALDPVRDFVRGLSAGTDVRVFTDVDGSLESVAGRAAEFTGDALVAIGGGSVIDTAKLVRFVRDAGTTRLDTGQRCGLRAVPGTRADAPRLVAIPTTVGTGAEVSSGAVTRVAGRPTLVRGLAMVPDEVWYCPPFFEALPRELQLRGVVEVLFRLLAPGLEAHQEERLPALLPLARSVVRAGERLCAGDDVPAALASILSVGAHTHGPEAHRGLHPFGSRVWYVTNEATAALGVPKLDVLPALWLAALHLARDGSLDWVPADRLRRVQTALGLEREPCLAPGLARTFRAWGVSTRLELGRTSAPALADTCLWRWGHGLPMLRRATRDDVALLLTTASAAPWSPSHEGPPTTPTSKGRR